MHFVILAYIPCTIALLTIGLLILLKNSRSMLNVSFSLLSFNLALWLAALFIGDLTLSHDISLWALRIASAIGSLLGPLMLLFCVNFPVKISRVPLYAYLIATAPALFFSFISLTPILIPDVEFVGHSAQPLDVGMLYTIQSLYLLVTWGLGFALVLKKYHKLRARERSQIKFVILGLVVTLLVNLSTGYVLTALGISNDYSNLIGTLSIVVFVIASAYAIIQYRLFDIRLAIVRFVGYVVTITIVSALYSVAVIVVGAQIAELTSASYRPLLILLVLTTILVSLTFHRLHKLINRLTMRVFYQNAYSTRVTLEELSDALLQENRIDKIMHASLQIIDKAIRPTKSNFIVVDDEGYIHKSHETLSEHNLKQIERMIQLLPAQKNLITEKYHVKDAGLGELFTQTDSEIALRLGTKAKPTGILLFSVKKDGRMYTSQDIELLRIAAKNLTIALDNAKKYEQISHFADTLKEEVSHATSRLRHANDRLKTLDELKDDFISMASHQFRTPSASIRQALQMINETKMTPKEQKEILRLAEANSQELVTLVGTMLSISRLQAGRFVLDKTLTNLGDIVQKVVTTTGVLVDQKEIKLNVEQPLPRVLLTVDSAKIREAMTNYVENAIKYSSSKSTVTIRLVEEKSKVRFEVQDQGMGVPEEERKHLFGKFYRAQNARKQQPDGNGIGLYVVKSIAETHGGEAYYSPADDGGSIFGLWLPIHPKEEYTSKDGSSVIH